MDPDRVLDDVPRDALEGRVALVTGGSRGIGLAAARGMARLGATLVLVGREPGRAETAAAKLVAEGLDAVGRSCDVSHAPAVRRLRESLGRLAEVDVLVCAAGVMSARTSKTLRTDPDEWRRVLGTNLDGVHYVVAELAPGKAAINAYAKNLAAEVGGGRRGVLVDAVCPAHCRTDMGGPDAPRSAEQGAATAVWLAARAVGDGVTTGMLWEDREPVDW